jgi:hypothetical protein
MRRAGLAVICLLAPLAAPPAADARSDYCSPTGDYCISVERHRSDFHLRLGTFSFTGRVTICVIPPRGGTTCRSFPLHRRSDGLRAVGVHWREHFPSRGPGTYQVRFRAAGGNLGPRLSFGVR